MFILLRINITSLIVTAARPIILFAVAAVTDGAFVLTVMTMTLAMLLLVLLLLVFELLLKLFDPVNSVVVLLVATCALTLAAVAVGLDGSVGLVDSALVGEVRIFIVRLPFLTVGALSLLVLELSRLLLLVREAGLLPRNLAIFRDVTGAARYLLNRL